MCEVSQFLRVTVCLYFSLFGFPQQIGAVALGQGLYNGPNLNVSNVPQAAAMGPTNAANLTAMGLAPIRDQSSAGATMDYRPPNFDASHQVHMEEI